MLEEVEVAPRLLSRVMRLAPVPPALRTQERPAALKVHVQVELPRLRIEHRARDVRLGETQRLLEQIHVVNRELPCPALASIVRARLGEIHFQADSGRSAKPVVASPSPERSFQEWEFKPLCSEAGYRISQPTRNSEEAKAAPSGAGTALNFKRTKVA